MPTSNAQSGHAESGRDGATSATALDDFTKFFLFKVNDLAVEPRDYEALAEFCRAAFYSLMAAAFAWMAACLTSNDFSDSLWRRLYNVIQHLRGLPGLPKPQGSPLEAFQALLPLVEILADREASDPKIRRVLQELELNECGVVPPGTLPGRTSHRAAFSFADDVVRETWYTVIGAAGVAELQAKPVPRFDPTIIKRHHWRHLSKKLAQFRRLSIITLIENINLELARGFDKRLQRGDGRHTPKVKVLFLASDSTGILRLDREAHRIEDELRASVHRDTFDFKTSWAVRADDLTREILYHAPRIVHFASHGEIDSLALASNACDEHHVTSESLVELFQKFRDQIRVVVINACKSKALARAISEYVDCAIGMDGLIDDSSAITFAYAFYRGIMAGQSVQGAFDLAKVELQLQNSGDANAPFLFCKSGIDPSNIVFTPISAA